MDRAQFALALIIFSQITVSWCIKKGFPVEENDFKAQVAIYGKNESTRIICGGTIITKNHVLTTASCVILQNYLVFPKDLNVLAGRTISIATPTNSIEAIYIHDKYNSRTFNNDIAIVRVKDDFKDFDKIVPNLETDVNENLPSCRIAGYHLETDLDQKGVQSTYTMVNVQTRDLCNAEANHNGKMLENMFCAVLSVGVSPEIEICQTSRGGGLYSSDYRNLYGVLSFGFGCGEEKVSSVYTQVGKYGDWIKKQLTRTDTPEYGPLAAPPGGKGTTVIANLWLIAFISTLGYYLAKRS